MDKPLRGHIKNWEWIKVDGGKYVVLGEPINGIPNEHAHRQGPYLRTSLIKDWYEIPVHRADPRLIHIETLNSRYYLFGEGKGYPEDE